jgi:signal transduction histidine kinase
MALRDTHQHPDRMTNGIGNRGSDATTGSSQAPGLVARLLRVPLVLKLAGANTVIVLGAAVGIVVCTNMQVGSTAKVVVMGTALITSLVVSIVLALLALAPLRAIESTLERFHAGDVTARVRPSQLADADLLRVSQTLNALLDGLNRDRERLRQMAERVIMHGDQERSQLARDLYDSTAQSIAAALMELSAAASMSDSAGRERLERVRRITVDVLEEIRALSHAAHPRLLEDRGLGVALPQLVQEFSDLGQSRIAIVAGSELDDVADGIGTVVYRVAQSALRQAVLQRKAVEVAVRTSLDDDRLLLEIEDNGRADGNSAADIEALEAMRPRIELAGGSLKQTRDRGISRTSLLIPRRTSTTPPRSVATAPSLT